MAVRTLVRAARNLLQPKSSLLPIPGVPEPSILPQLESVKGPVATGTVIDSRVIVSDEDAQDEDYFTCMQRA